MTKAKQSKQITFILRNEIPMEAKFLNIYYSQTPIRIGTFEHVAGADLLRKLIMLGIEAIERDYPGQFIQESSSVEQPNAMSSRKGASREKQASKTDVDERLVRGIDLGTEPL